ncbi:hypothetical protein [Paenibacillus gansuensis]|uniref:Uncharacterized protein n=1 Tax=Paenibacillus gansuensis TaxID=306542 RepID=A0ABW5PCX5_9BACL
MLTTVFIDYVRILVAGRQAEHALKASVQSVLAAYDPSLQSYGLYGVSLSEEEMTTLAREVSTRNLPSSDKASFSFTDTKANEQGIRVHGVHSLANAQVMEQEILEEMKYKAPVEFTLRLIEMFSNIRTETLQTNTFASNADELDKLIRLRDDHLKQAYHRWSEWEQANVIAGNDRQVLFHQLSQTENEIGQASSAGPLVGSKRNQEEEEARKQRLAQLRSSIDSIWSRLQVTSDRQIEADSSFFKEITRQLELAQQADSKVLQFLERLKTQQQAQSTSGQAAGSTSPLDAVFQQKWTLEEAYYASFKGQAGSVSSVNAGYHEQIRQRASSGSDHSAHMLTISELFANRHRLEQPRIASAEEDRLKREEAKRQTQQEMDLAKQQMMATGCDLSDIELYGKLEGPEGAAASFRKGLAAGIAETGATGSSIESAAGNPLDVPPETSGKASVSSLASLFSEIEKIRNDIYVNEYVLSNMNYRTIEFDSKKLPKPEALSRPAEHPLRKQEAEYILYGSPSCHLNLTLAYAEMYTTRLAIRTIEALLTPKSAAAAVTPWVMFLTAVAEGASKARVDMSRLTAGEQVELMARWPNVTLNYKDYIRLFYFLHPNYAGRLSRIQALLQVNTGTVLHNTAYYVRGELPVSVKLWFVPGLIKLLEWGNALDGTVRGSRYEWVARTAHSY